jgi:hypothetical protein
MEKDIKKYIPFFVLTIAGFVINIVWFEFSHDPDKEIELHLFYRTYPNLMLFLFIMYYIKINWIRVTLLIIQLALLHFY